MTKIEVFDNKYHINLEKWEDKIEIKNSEASFFLIGLIRENKNKILKKASLILKNNFNENQIQDLFNSIHGEYFILIECKEIILIYLNYACPQFYISEDNDNKKLTLTHDESFFNKSSFDKNRFLINIFSNQGFFVPGGVFSDVTDFLLPGMSIKIDKKTNKYEQSWIIPIRKFCTERDHEKVAKKLANDFIEEMESYKCLDSELKLELSSGLDSALMLAAAKAADLPIEPVNFRPYLREGESVGAKQIATFFGFELTEMYRGPTDSNDFFSVDSNIDDYLQKMSPLLKTGSGMFILDNVSLLIPYNYCYCDALEGSAFPTALCINHHVHYPKVSINPKTFFKNLNFKANSDIRYYYSKDYIESRLSKTPIIDNWDISKNWPDIHEFYYEFLEPCFTGHIDGYRLFQVFSECEEVNERLGASLKERGYVIIDKIMLSSYFKQSLTKPSVKTAMKLMKIIVFINNVAWASSKLFNYRSAGIFSEFRPGLNSKILVDLLSVEIDQTLVNYPKWHIFRAFELISREKFFNIRKIGIIFLIKNFLKNQIFSMKYNINNIEKVRKEILVNKSVKKFIEKNNIMNKYYDILKDLDLDEKVPTININEIKPKKFSLSDFWYLNNILNIVELKERHS